MNSNRRVTLAFLLIAGAIAVGIFGYMVIEDYTFFEGFYMSVITLTTVGFGEVKPLSGEGVDLRHFISCLVSVVWLLQDMP